MGKPEFLDHPDTTRTRKIGRRSPPHFAIPLRLWAGFFFGALTVYRRLMWKPIAALALLLMLTVSVQADVVGEARVIDGDTIEFGHGQVVRLFGIDAPEIAQRCDGPKALSKCGEVAADALAELISRKTLACQGHDVDSYKRLIATCQVDGTDISA